MTNRLEKINQIEEAMGLIEEAMQMVDDVVEDMSINSNYEAYGRYGFDQLLGNGNPYDSSLQTIIDEIEDDDEDEE